MTEVTVKETAKGRRQRRKRTRWGWSRPAERNRSRLAKLFDVALAWGKPGVRALTKWLRTWGLRIAGLVLVLLLALAASVTYPFLRYAPPPFGATLPGGAILIDGGGSNVYALRVGSHVVLVDCGRDPAMTGVAAALKTWGLGLDAVKAVLITHAHPDHIGGCAAVPGAQFLALDKEVAAIEGREIVPGLLSMVTFARPKPAGLHEVLSLKDGADFFLNGTMVTIYAVPGHTPGSAAYLIGPALFVGDAVAFGKDGSVVGGPWIFNSDGSQMPASRRALAKSLAGMVESVATGHTAPGSIKAMSEE